MKRKYKLVKEEKSPNFNINSNKNTKVSDIKMIKHNLNDKYFPNFQLKEILKDRNYKLICAYNLQKDNRLQIAYVEESNLICIIDINNYSNKSSDKILKLEGHQAKIKKLKYYIDSESKKECLISLDESNILIIWEIINEKEYFLYLKLENKDIDIRTENFDIIKGINNNGNYLIKQQNEKDNDEILRYMNIQNLRDSIYIERKYYLEILMLENGKFFFRINISKGTNLITYRSNKTNKVYIIIINRKEELILYDLEE